MDHCLTFFGVKVQQDLRVSLSTKLAPTTLEQRAQLLVIVDLSIKGDDELAIRARHRLRTAFGKVDDRQPAMPETHTLILRIPLANSIGAARSHMIANAPQLGAINRVGSVMIRVDARDATHGLSFRPLQMRFVRRIGLLSVLRNSNPASAKRMPSKH